MFGSSRTKEEAVYKALALMGYDAHVKNPLVTPISTVAQVQLTEEETEYSVVAVKHVFEAAIALQFTCSNTVAEQILEDVTVAVDLAEAVRCNSASKTLAQPCHLPWVSMHWLRLCMVAPSHPQPPQHREVLAAGLVSDAAASTTWERF